MSIATADMKYGLQVRINDKPEVWEVLDKAPRPGAWWLHRWDGDRWMAAECRQSEMNPAQELSPVLTRSDKWKKGPFNVSSPAVGGPLRVQGHVVGLWGVHRNESKAWVLTHLPTGMSVPTSVALGTHNPGAADLRGLAERLAGYAFPALDAVPFGATPGVGTRGDITRLRELLSERTVKP